MACSFALLIKFASVIQAAAKDFDDSFSFFKLACLTLFLEPGEEPAMNVEWVAIRIVVELFTVYLVIR